MNFEESQKRKLRKNLAKRNVENKSQRRFARELIKFDIKWLRWWRENNRG